MESIDMRVETPDSVREKAIEAFGLNEPSGLDLVKGRGFANDDALLDAAVKAEMERANPEYRDTYKRLKGELQRQREQEARQAESEAYKKVRASTELHPMYIREINEQAKELAYRDLSAGRIPASDLGKTIEAHANELTEKKKDEIASAKLFNAVLRGEL